MATKKTEYTYSCVAQPFLRIVHETEAGHPVNIH